VARRRVFEPPEAVVDHTEADGIVSSLSPVVSGRRSPTVADCEALHRLYDLDSCRALVLELCLLPDAAGRSYARWVCGSPNRKD